MKARFSAELRVSPPATRSAWLRTATPGGADVAPTITIGTQSTIARRGHVDTPPRGRPRRRASPPKRCYDGGSAARLEKHGTYIKKGGAEHLLTHVSSRFI